MKYREWALPNPSVDITVEELADLRHQLKNVAESLEDLLLPE
jgi:hypothetical protein